MHFAKDETPKGHTMLTKFTTALVAATLLLGPAFAAETGTPPTAGSSTPATMGSTTQAGTAAKHLKTSHRLHHRHIVHHQRHLHAMKHIAGSKSFKHAGSTRSHKLGKTAHTGQGDGRAQSQSGQEKY